MPCRPDHLDWVVPMWWMPLNGKESRISRRVLVNLWVKHPPPPSGSTFRDALHGWCTEATEAGWVREEYTIRAVARLKDKLSSDVEDAEGWDQVSALIADYLDSFARFTLRFGPFVKSHKPKKVPAVFFPGRIGKQQALSSLLDEAARGPITTAVKSSMIHDDNGGQVFSSLDSADRFLSDPERYLAVAGTAAMRAYGSKLLEFVARVDDDELFGETVREAVDILWDTAMRIQQEFGALDLPPRRLTPEEDGLVREFMTTAPQRWLAGEDSTGAPPPRYSPHWPEILTRAVERTGRSLRKAVGEDRLHFTRSGHVVVLEVQAERSLAASMFWSNIRFAAMDVRRDGARENSIDATPHVVSASVPARKTVTRDAGPTPRHHVDAVEYDLSAALDYLDRTPDRELKAANFEYNGPESCWEKSVATDFFRTALEHESVLDASPRIIGRAAREYALVRYEDEWPEKTMRSSTDGSADLVSAIVLEAITAGRVDTESHRSRNRPPLSRRTTDAIIAYNRRNKVTETEQS